MSTAKAWAFQVAQWWRIFLPMQEMQETWVQSLGQEDPLEEEMATHFSILALNVPWVEEPGGLKSMGSQRVKHNWVTEHVGRYKWVKVKFLKKGLNNLSAMNFIFKRQKLWDCVSRKINTIMFLKDKNLESLFFYKHVWYE